MLFGLLVELFANGGDLLVFFVGGGSYQFHNGGVDGNVGVGDQAGQHGLRGCRVAVLERIDTGRFFRLLGLVELLQHGGHAFVLSRCGGYHNAL